MVAVSCGLVLAAPLGEGRATLKGERGVGAFTYIHGARASCSRLRAAASSCAEWRGLPLLCDDPEHTGAVVHACSVHSRQSAAKLSDTYYNVTVAARYSRVLDGVHHPSPRAI